MQVPKFGQETFISNAMGVPAYSKIEMTYDANDNIKTVTYINGTTTVAVLTLGYDLSNRLASVERTA